MPSRLFASRHHGGASPSPPPPPPPPPYGLHFRSSKNFILATVTMSVFTDIFLYGVIVPVLPFALEQRAGVAHENLQHWVAILLAVYAAGLLVSSPIWGWIADNTESRGVPFSAGLLALMASTALLCVGNSIPILVVGRLLQGISAALVWSVGLAILSDTVGAESLGEAMGWVSLGMGLGIFLGPMLGGVVYAKGGYYAVFGMCFALLGVDTVLRIAMIEKKVAARYPVEKAVEHPENGELEKKTAVEAPVQEDAPSSSDNSPSAEATAATAATATATVSSPPPPSTQYKTRLPNAIILLKTPRILAILFAALVTATLLTSFDSTLPLFVAQLFHWDSLGAGLIFLAICVPTFLEPVIGYLCDRFGSRYIASLGFLLALPFFVLLRLVTQDSTGHKVLLCALLFLLGASLSLTMPPLLAEATLGAQQVEREKPGIFGEKGAFAQAYGLFNVAYAAGSMIGPLWAGFLIESGGLATVGWSLGLLSAATAVPVFLYVGGEFWKRKKLAAEKAAEEEIRAVGNEGVSAGGNSGERAQQNV